MGGRQEVRVGGDLGDRPRFRLSSSGYGGSGCIASAGISPDSFATSPPSAKTSYVRWWNSSCSPREAPAWGVLCPGTACIEARLLVFYGMNSASGTWANSRWR